MDPFSRLLGSTANDLECFGRKTKIDRYFKFSIFRLAPKTEKLNHATDCNIVREAKLSLSFVFLFTVQRIKVKISVMFSIFYQRKKIKIFSS